MQFATDVRLGIKSQSYFTTGGFSANQFVLAHDQRFFFFATEPLLSESL
jgi:hypothetical protein